MRSISAPPDGDASFYGVNQADPPGTLAPGEVADAQNLRFRDGRASCRLGPVKLPWTNRVTAGASSAPIPFGVIYGSGSFRDGDDLQWAILAADGKVFRTREGNGSAEISLPPGVTVTSEVTFEQTYSGLIMFRGSALPPLRMRTIDAGWEVMPQSSGLFDANVPNDGTENPTDGTEVIPNADRGEWINGRLFIPYATATEKDMVAISDFSNATRYAPVRSQARINQGSSDKLVRIIKFGKSEIAICFKENSIYELAGISGSLGTMSQDEVTKEYGLAAPKAAINVGKDEADAPDEVWFLANKRGICRITPDASTGRLGVQSIPVSREIKNLIERIHWGAISGATFATWDNKFFAAVPIDDARVEGRNLVRSLSYNGSSQYVFPVIPGASYKWTKSTNDFSLANGSETLTDTSDFTAAGATVTLASTAPSVSVTATIQRVFKDCNNAVLVFDFEKGKWAGVDVGSAIQVKEWLKLRFGGEERLFFLGEDGFINCYEWLYEDQAAYESLGSNLTAGRNFTGLGLDFINVLPGRTYVYSIQAYTTSMVNGTQTITAGAGTLVAQGTQLYFYGPAGFAVGTFIYLVDWTLENEDIDHWVVPRAYRSGSLHQKRGTWARFHFRSWWPEISISEITEGVEEETARLTDHTKSRTVYTEPYNRAAWDETNVNDDHATPKREDYSVVLAETTTASGAIVAGTRYFVESSDVTSACSIDYNGVTVNGGSTFLGVAGVATFTVLSGTPLVYPPGSYVYLGNNGVDPDLHQEWSQDLRLHARGREHQLKVRGTQGRVELVAIEFLAREVDQRPGMRT